ncbi:hypothetical protein D9K80_08190 [Acinetobacter cumulans]|uniref:Lipoprotein n=2 Tax=Acinetobacter TaxID=469 RepID=A0A498CWK6_9GAMM|nr:MULTISPECIES: hypothetical protein [Acinetobacter]RFS24365.1 hypothetical protein DYI81_17420 [Acinetobacter sp. SWAC5]RKG42719.1 hypothetical protein D7V31_07050 [Acinetobacter sp. WCHAc060007]RLL22799.1 hypothetical protein D9K81_06270 [Acinetobacter chengduensis]RLL35430.1 hypothetical protein D9K80_08190 [Acinetobacter cumulans]
MHNLIKTLGLTTLLSLSALAFQGCSSGLEPETFSVELNEQGTYSWSTPVITIRSNVAEPIEVTNVTVNNGQCTYIGHDKQFNFPLHFKMGQVFRLRLRGCSFENVVQVDIETNKGNGSYQFN